MTNEEKAKQLYRKYKETNLARESTAFNAAMEMAKWKDKQFNEILKRANEAVTKAFEEGAKIERGRMVEKAINWLKEHMVNYGEIWMGGWNGDSYDQDAVDNSLIRDFKQAMMEE